MCFEKFRFHLPLLVQIFGPCRKLSWKYKSISHQLFPLKVNRALSAWSCMNFSYELFPIYYEDRTFIFIFPFPCVWCPYMYQRDTHRFQNSFAAPPSFPITHRVVSIAPRWLRPSPGPRRQRLHCSWSTRQFAGQIKTFLRGRRIKWWEIYDKTVLWRVLKWMIFAPRWQITIKLPIASIVF